MFSDPSLHASEKEQNAAAMLAIEDRPKRHSSLFPALPIAYF
jgi:hypothetical protein